MVRWPAPLTASDLDGLRFAFLPVKDAPPAVVVATFDTANGRPTLTSHRERLARLPCDDPVGRVLDETDDLRRDLPELDVVARGTFRSLDLRAGETATLPYLLALPAGFSEDTPVVLGVDGLTGSAARMLRSHGGELARRGIGLLAIDLPEHGERGRGGEGFIDVLDPIDVGASLQQAVVDVLAAVHALRVCGLRLPERAPVRRDEVPYLGYSLGAMVGVITRGVEPHLGVAVLFAPAGDIPGWLMLKAARRLTARPYVSCLGGADHGRSCFPDGRCAAPGLCTVDPFVHWLTSLTRLPYGLATAGADPLEYARLRTGPASKSPVLLLTGGRDGTLHLELQEELSDAYDMRPVSPRVSRGPRSVRFHWPELGHGLVDDPEVRTTAYEFLGSGGRIRWKPADGAW